MRTKTLLLAVAALAAGVISSEAQNVYSQNVVGYINVPMPAGQQVLVANPLDDGTNTVTSLGASLANKSQIQTWNGAGFTLSSKGGGVWTTNLSIPVGTAFFVKSFTTITNTFVGNVVVLSGGSGTNSLPAGTLQMVGEQIPYGGDLNDTTNVNLGSTLANKSQIQVWNGSGFTLASKGGGNWTTNLTITPAEGFFVKSFTATNWVQTADY
jgi:hypothetical protein